MGENDRTPDYSLTGVITMTKRPYQFEPVVSEILLRSFEQWHDSARLHEKTMEQFDQLPDMGLVSTSWPSRLAIMTLICSVGAVICSILVLVH